MVFFLTCNSTDKRKKKGARMIKEKYKKSLSRELCKTILNYFEDDDHRKEFEDWYFDKYGVEYEWTEVTKCHKEKEEKEHISA